MIPSADAFDLEGFQKALLDWYQVHARPLPWRHTTDPYAIWVSEVMLQQTRVDTVLPYYRRFLDIFPDVSSLAHATESQVLKAWEGLGYYGRARNLHLTAKILCERYGGTFPDNEPELRSLPGIGNYIVAAVLSFAFGNPIAVLDGNVLRVLARVFSIDRAINDPKARSFFQQIAQMLLPAVSSGLHNQAMMELGALTCVSRHPLCVQCPVDRFCTSRKTHRVDRYPIRKTRRQVPIRRMVIAVFVRKDGRMLLIQRPSEGLLGGLWEFPNIEIDAAASFEEGMHRLCASLPCGSTLARRRLVGCVRHAYTHFKVVAEVFQVDLIGEPNGIQEIPSSGWVDRTLMERYPLSKLTHKVLRLMGKEER